MSNDPARRERFRQIYQPIKYWHTGLLFPDGRQRLEPSTVSFRIPLLLVGLALSFGIGWLWSSSSPRPAKQCSCQTADCLK